MEEKEEDGMGFAGLVPTAQERRDEAYWNERGKIAFAREQQLAKTGAEVERLTATLAAKDAEIKLLESAQLTMLDRAANKEAELAKLRETLEQIRLMTDTDFAASTIAELALAAGEGG